jgi:hypothetical protein
MRTLAMAAIVLLTGCGSHGDRAVMKIVQRATAENGNGGAPAAQVEGVKPVRAEGYPAVREFSVAERTAAMEKFPCLKCHNKPMEQLRRAQTGKKAAHWEVKLEHAQESTMNCATCHLNEDLDSLATLNRTKVGMNHAYQVCAQCHSRQAADWAGGAHGKRLGGWAPPRVVESCAGCHNPHKPKLEPRLPVLAEKRGMR